MTFGDTRRPAGFRRRSTPPRRSHLLRAVPLLLAAVGARADPAPDALNLASADLILTNVHVVDVVEGVVLRDRTVAIEAGRISAVFTADEAQGLEVSSQRMETGGRYLIPGLWDMHVHFRGGDSVIEENRALLPLYIANGFTTVRDAGGDITSAIFDWRAQIAEGSLLGPRILTSGPKLDGPANGWDGSIRLSAPGQVAAAFDSLQALGVDCVKIYDGSTSKRRSSSAAERRTPSASGRRWASCSLPSTRRAPPSSIAGWRGRVRRPSPPFTSRPLSPK